MAHIESVLDPDAQQVAGQALQHTLVDLIDLSLVTKQAHWTVTGPRFRTLHQQLDEVVDTTRRHADTVAERAATIGVAPDGRAAAVAARSTIPQWAPGWERDELVLEHFIDAYTKLIAGLRERITAVANADPVTQDLLIAVTADLEKQLWEFQAEQQQ
ncbi:Dps family protein [Micromonospora sp. RV43]|uniref:Dps family protein n=1 Tax=Micromonospora sp. RV43 TaxID=1661387 RepID=UPI00064C292F|nr:DNA starvation/stationary phase protection protein [Micromonospora sp. RV43]